MFGRSAAKPKLCVPGGLVIGPLYDGVYWPGKTVEVEKGAGAQGGSALVNFFGIQEPSMRVPVTDVHPLYSNLHMIDAYLEGRIMGQALAELRATLFEPEQVEDFEKAFSASSDGTFKIRVHKEENEKKRKASHQNSPSLSDADADADANTNQKHKKRAGKFQEASIKEPGHGKAPAPAQQQQPERPPRVAISKWVGAGVPRQEGGTKYEAFFKNKQIFREGDCAFLRPDDDDDEPYIVRIISLWESPDGKMMLRGSWLYRQHDQTGIKKPNPPVMKREVLLSDWSDDNQLESVMSHAMIRFTSTPPPEAHAHSNSDCPWHFFCYRAYHVKAKKISPLQGKELESLVQKASPSASLMPGTLPSGSLSSLPSSSPDLARASATAAAKRTSTNAATTAAARETTAATWTTTKTTATSVNTAAARETTAATATTAAARETTATSVNTAAARETTAATATTAAARETTTTTSVNTAAARETTATTATTAAARETTTTSVNTAATTAFKSVTSFTSPAKSVTSFTSPAKSVTSFTSPAKSVTSFTSPARAYAGVLATQSLREKSGKPSKEGSSSSSSSSIRVGTTVNGAPSHSPARRDDNPAHSGKHGIPVRPDAARAGQQPPGDKHKANALNFNASPSSLSTSSSSTAKLRPDSAPSKRSNQASATLVSKRSNQASATLVGGSNQASATLFGGSNQASATLVSKRSNQAIATLVGGSNQASATLVSKRSNQASATLVGGSNQASATLVGGSNQASATLVSKRSNQAIATLVGGSNQASATLVGGARHSGLAPAVAGLAKGDTAPTFSRVLTYSSVIAGLSGALPEAPKHPPVAGPTSQGEEERSVEDEEIRKGGKGRTSREGEAGPERIEAQQGFLPVGLVGRNAARVAISSNDGCSMSMYVPFEGGVDDWKPIAHRIAKWGGVKLINMKNVLAKTPLVFSTPTACKAMSLSLDGQTLCCLSEAGVVTSWEIKSGVRRMGLQTNREGGSNEVLCLAYIHGSRLICLGGGIRESVCVGGAVHVHGGNKMTAEGYVDFVVSDTANPMRIWVGEGIVCAIDCGWYSGSAYMFIAQENGVVTVFKWDGKAGSYMFQARQELDTKIRSMKLTYQPPEVEGGDEQVYVVIAAGTGFAVLEGIDLAPLSFFQGVWHNGCADVCVVPRCTYHEFELLSSSPRSIHVVSSGVVQDDINSPYAKCHRVHLPLAKPSAGNPGTLAAEVTEFGSYFIDKALIRTPLPGSHQTQGRNCLSCSGRYVLRIVGGCMFSWSLLSRQITAMVAPERGESFVSLLLHPCEPIVFLAQASGSVCVYQQDGSQ